MAENEGQNQDQQTQNDQQQTTDTSALEARVAELQGQLDQINRDSQGSAVVDAIEQQLANIDPKAENAAEQYSAVARRVATAYANHLSKTFEPTMATARDARAEALALRLQVDHGGDYQPYKSELLKAKSYDEMSLAKDRIDLRLQQENVQKARGEEGRRVTVDNGRGAAQRSSVSEEIEAIDVTTPEGLKEWNQKRGELMKKAQAAAGR